MEIPLGIKSDPIENRYTFDWLFALLEELGVRYVQLGSFPELYSLEDDWFAELREKASKRGITIKSCFTTHRDLGGFFSGDAYLERAARRMYERYIQVAAIVGAESIGGNPGSVPRDRPQLKEPGIECYLAHMRELMSVAREAGLKWLAIEPMSCLAEPPTLPEELERMLGALEEHHRRHPDSTVPVYLCSDIGHGYADREGRVVYDNWSLFEAQIPRMAAFHFKNTDERFEAVFGFSAEERRRGIVDLRRLKELIERNERRFPIRPVIGYFETGGPKLGRDYSDPLLRGMIRESINAIQEVFGGS